jgi:hypothetical protein
MASSYIDQALEKLLKATSAVTDIIDKRLYYGKAPANAKLPHVVFFQAAPDNTPIEFGQEQSGAPMFQFTCVSRPDKTPTDAFLVGWAIINTLRHYQDTYDGVQIKNIDVKGPKTIPDEQTERMYCIVEAEVIYIEP